ncbi:MAG: Hint domain-containing protein [Chloroflexi bacterium]|nr:Hint domain-containing protein [Chloroflexota bacterium]
MRRHAAPAVFIVLVMGISACGGATAPTVTTEPSPGATQTAAPSAAVMATPAATVVTQPTDQTGAVTSTAVSQPEPTAAATRQPVASLSLSALKYLLIDKFGPVGKSPGIFFCDPDVYPVARASESDQAAKWIASVDKTSDEYRAILLRLNLTAAAQLSADQVVQVYQEHKRLNAINLEPVNGAYQFNLRVAMSGAGKGQSGQLIEGTITAAGEVAIQRQQPTILTCPICLALGTRIDTPDGPVAVENIRAGMRVWTVDSTGARVAAVVLETSHTSVAPDYRVVHVRLADGRELFASAGHPTVDGRTVGALAPGDLLDGARVISASREPYAASETYDLLPAGATGFYWANGVLVGSTLAR